jgi:hypothetical protein
MIVPRAHLGEHIQLAKLVIAGKFSELIFNLDEVDSSDWEDRKPKSDRPSIGFSGQCLSFRISLIPACYTFGMYSRS